MTEHIFIRDFSPARVFRSIDWKASLAFNALRAAIGAAPAPPSARSTERCGRVAESPFSHMSQADFDKLVKMLQELARMINTNPKATRH